MRRIFLVLITLVSMNSNAYLLTNDEGNVTSNGMEWLRWDLTIGLSIDEALSRYPEWRLASNEEMANLLNTFIDPIIRKSIATTNGNQEEFTADEENNQAIDPPPIFIENVRSYATLFHSLFGSYNVEITNSNNEVIDIDAIQAFYGSDTNGNDRFNLASVISEDLYPANSNRFISTFPQITLSPDLYRADYSNNNISVALVKGYNDPTIPEPSSIALIALGFIGFRFLRRKSV